MKLNIKNFLFLAAVLTGFLASCEKEKEGGIDLPENKNTESFAMVYEDFITPDDIVINSDDTTMIAVSKKYADKIGVNYFKDRVVTIWRSIDSAPFIRLINKAELHGDNIILTTERAEVADMFENLDMDFDSDLYINRNFMPTKATRGVSDYEVYDMSGKYTDDEGVVHPAVIIFEESDNELAKSIATRSGTEVKNYFTAEELLANNFEFDLINMKELSLNLDHTIAMDEDSLFTIDINGKAEASAKLTIFGSMKVGFFSLKEFKFGLRGDAELKTKIGVDFNIQKELEYENDIVQLGKTTLVFWAGPIPIPLTVEPKLTYKSELEAEAKLELYASAKVGGEFQAGMEYKSDRKEKWKNLGHGKTFKTVTVDGIFPDDTTILNPSGSVGISAAADASFGVYWETGMYLAGTAGPKFSTGPKIGVSAEVEGELDVVTGDFTAGISAGAYTAWGGDVGVKFKVFGYNIGELKYEYELLRYEFIKYENELTYNLRSGKSEFEQGWAVLLLDNENWDEDLDDNAVENPGELPPPSISDNDN